MGLRGFGRLLGVPLLAWALAAPAAGPDAQLLEAARAAQPAVVASLKAMVAIAGLLISSRTCQGMDIAWILSGLLT